MTSNYTHTLTHTKHSWFLCFMGKFYKCMVFMLYFILNLPLTENSAFLQLKKKKNTSLFLYQIYKYPQRGVFGDFFVRFTHFWLQICPQNMDKYVYASSHTSQHTEIRDCTAHTEKYSGAQKLGKMPLEFY